MEEINVRTLTSFMGLRVIFDCLIDRLLSPIFFTDFRVLIFIEFCLTGGRRKETVSIKT